MYKFVINRLPRFLPFYQLLFTRITMTDGAVSCTFCCCFVVVLLLFCFDNFGSSYRVMIISHLFLNVVVRHVGVFHPRSLEGV